jgi:queuine tRNA-ribosyltransferase
VAPREAEASWRRTLAWARRAREEAEEVRAGALFGIVQGSTDRELRQRAAEEIAGVGFDGHAIGGVSVGEPPPLRRQVVEWTAPLLPADRPRYLMGVGFPEDILHAVAWGVDLFDCVLPARNARHGVLFTRDGVLKIKQARYRDDPAPVEEGCPCPACRRVSRAFLHHLVRSGELTGAVLATAHNLRHYLDLMAGVRQAIASGTFSEPAAASPEAAPPFPEDPGGPARRVPEPRGA